MSSRPRIIVPRCAVNSATVDAFYCSVCHWLYLLPHPKPFLIASEDAETACHQFDLHRCRDFEARGIEAAIGAKHDAQPWER